MVTHLDSTVLHSTYEIDILHFEYLTKLNVFVVTISTEIQDATFDFPSESFATGFVWALKQMSVTQLQQLLDGAE